MTKENAGIPASPGLPFVAKVAIHSRLQKTDDAQDLLQASSGFGNLTAKQEPHKHRTISHEVTV